MEENERMTIIELGGRQFELAEDLKKRIRIGETTLNKYVRGKVLPSPLKIAGRRYFDRDEVDRWLLRRR
jgi:hypothetical protein